MNILGDNPQVRKYLYATYALVGVLVGVLHIVYGDPEWLDVSTQVYAYLGVALGLTAHSNVSVPED